VNLRIRGRKVHITEAFRGLGYTVVAIGDSSNDLTMLQAASYPVLYNPTADLRKTLPAAPSVTNYVELKNVVERIPADE
jgi:phosphoserine phosphatase